MAHDTRSKGEQIPETVICCSGCRHFRLFQNSAGHNSPHALGECRGGEPWDGSRGQWAMFQHHCNGFETTEA